MSRWQLSSAQPGVQGAMVRLPSCFDTDFMDLLMFIFPQKGLEQLVEFNC